MGSYQDYFTGEWDGVNHLDEGRSYRRGYIWHGHMVPYLVPTTESFIAYIRQVHIRRVIDAGIDAIYLEEPEFWAERVTARHSSANGRSITVSTGVPSTNRRKTPTFEQAKYHLYYNALDKVFTFAKEYGRQKGWRSAVTCRPIRWSIIRRGRS